MAVIDYTVPGATFSRLTVIGEPFRRGKNNLFHVACKCECGKETVVLCTNLAKGHTNSCGCMAREQAAQRMRARRKHGHTWDENAGGRIRTTTYKSWRSAKERCSNSKAPNYPEYGGRGITVCERWQEFVNFLADMGERPAGTTLDRYPDVNGNYEPGNCRWATPKEQAANRRNSVWIEVNGVMTTTAAVAEQMGVSTQVLFKRLKAGWSVERTVSTPVRSKSPKAA